MSLEDQFYSKDNSLINIVDTSLIKAAGCIGSKIQSYTNISQKQMLKGLDYTLSTSISALGFMIGIENIYDQTLLGTGSILASAGFLTTSFLNKNKDDTYSPVSEEKYLIENKYNKNSQKALRLKTLTIAGGLMMNDFDINNYIEAYATIGLSAHAIRNYLKLAKFESDNLIEKNSANEKLI